MLRRNPLVVCDQHNPFYRGILMTKIALAVALALALICGPAAAMSRDFSTEETISFDLIGILPDGSVVIRVENRAVWITNDGRLFAVNVLEDGTVEVVAPLTGEGGVCD
jgi:hypothetical protein